MKLAPLILVAVLPLTGCMQTFSGSVAGGECKAFERPPYAVKGKTRYDQDVADGFVETGVAACRWPRPAARPAAIDAPRATSPAAPPKKKPGIVKRIRDRLSPSPRPQFPAAAAPVMPTPEIPKTAAPRAPIDELLQPNG